MTRKTRVVPYLLLHSPLNSGSFLERKEDIPSEASWVESSIANPPASKYWPRSVGDLGRNVQGLLGELERERGPLGQPVRKLLHP